MAALTMKASKGRQRVQNAGIPLELLYLADLCKTDDAEYEAETDVKLRDIAAEWACPDAP